jgi:hypothetical protein
LIYLDRMVGSCASWVSGRADVELWEVFAGANQGETHRQAGKMQSARRNKKKVEEG